MKSKRIFVWVGLPILLIGVLYATGPVCEYDSVDLDPLTLNVELEDLDTFVKDLEEQVPDLKEDNEARIIWADTVKQKTPFSVVYLHGFSASQEEGDPLHTEFAKRYGCNLYLSRLYDHGRTTADAFKEVTPQDFIQSAKEAIAIGRILGEKIILISCSTGGTYSAMLAPYDDDIAALFMFSPNIDLADPTSELITLPWGKNLLTTVMGGEYNKIQYDSLPAQYWSEKYHVDGILALKYMIEEYVTEDLIRQIDQPVFLGYYYKSEDEKDQIVSVDKMLWFFDHIGTDAEKKRKIAFPDAGAHVLTSHVFSKDLESVRSETFEFAEKILELTPVSDY